MKKRISIGQLLLHKNYIKEKELQECLAQAKLLKKRIGQIAVDLGFVTEEQLTEVLSEQTGLPIAPIKNLTISQEILALIPAKYCKKHRVVPYHKANNLILVVMNDPLDIQALNDISLMLGYQVKPALCTDSELKELLQRQSNPHETQESSVQSLVHDINSEMFDEGFDKSSNQNLESLVNDAPIIKLVNLIIEKAIIEKASDIHIEKYKKSIVIRYRIDGILYDSEAPPSHMFNVIISRLKLMSGMNIAEYRLPQDGRITFQTEQTEVDLRVSTLPSINGESIVLRILDKTQELLDIEKIGLQGDNLHQFLQLIQQPHGIILLTGPTGSGKTTALYAALTRIQSSEKKIITIEDPVEYQLDRINQLNINPQIGFTFAAGLRHILRQDPDIMMVGEIRDNETAEIAIRSALTGHLLFSTLHTNSAVGAISRLTNMNIEPYLLASTLTGVLAQRLIRILCPLCKTNKRTRPEDIHHISGFSKILTGPINIFEPQGCKACFQSGYKGRIGIFELLILTDSLKELVNNQVTGYVLRTQARKEGLKTLREDGLNKVIQGLTSLEEVLRVTQDDEDK
jgi:type II secretion system protein E